MELTVLAFFALFGLIELNQSEAWNPFHKDSAIPFDTINELLVKNVPSDDIQANMAAAKEIYAKRAKGKRDSLVKALDNFVALETIVQADRCNRQGYEVLHALDLGTRGQALTKNPARRIDKIVRHYAIEHSNFCYRLYPELVETSMARVDSRHRDYAKQLDYKQFMLQELDIWSTPEERDKGENCRNIKVAWEEDKLENLDVYYPLSKSAEAVAAAGDENSGSKYLDRVGYELRGTRAVDKEKVKEMFDTYIYNPCEEMNEKVADEYLDPIRFGLTVQRKTGVPEWCSQTIYDRLILGYCRELARDKKYRQKIFERLVESIKSKPKIEKVASFSEIW